MSQRDEGRPDMISWGPRVDLTELRELYAPREVEEFTVPPGGIDNLALHSTDVFTILGRGEFPVDFTGYFRVARDHPTTDDWLTFHVRVNIVHLQLVGQHQDLGEIAVSLNPGFVSAGEIFGAPSAQAAAKCRIATSATFDVREMGVTLFNKEPILLMNDHVTRIPPVNDDNQKALLFKLPLYNRADPQGEPVAYLDSLRYGADHYVTESEARSFLEMRSQDG